tara:strand:+ start:1557 stop:1757 length:201 start_codon:yes stop_codon:yes gene_type:complete
VLVTSLIAAADIRFFYAVRKRTVTKHETLTEREREREREKERERGKKRKKRRASELKDGLNIQHST